MTIRMNQQRSKDKIKDNFKKKIRTESQNARPLNCYGETNEINNEYSCSPHVKLNKNRIFSCQIRKQLSAQNKIPYLPVFDKFRVFMWLMKNTKLNIFQAIYLIKLNIPNDYKYIDICSPLTALDPVKEKLISQGGINFVERENIYILPSQKDLKNIIDIIHKLNICEISLNEVQKLYFKNKIICQKHQSDPKDSELPLCKKRVRRFPQKLKFHLK